MTTYGLPWRDDDDARHLVRWSAAATVVVCAHAALIGGYLFLHPPIQEIGDDASVITVELAPIDSVADASRRDVAPGPEDTVEQKPVPHVEKVPDQPTIEPTPPPLLATKPDVVPPEPKPPRQTEEEQPPAPRTTARVQGGAPRVEPTWEAVLVKHLQEYKRYPGAAQARGEQGVVVLGFSVNRDGHVLTHRIVRSSGYAELDREVMEMIERAQPLPAFPHSMTQATLDLTVPIRFSLR